jgi:hypothetical protein
MLTYVFLVTMYNRKEQFLPTIAALSMVTDDLRDILDENERAPRPLHIFHEP